MPKNPIDELTELANKFPRIREQFKLDVAQACAEVNIIATKISGAIGEISVEEAKKVIINEFKDSLMS